MKANPWSAADRVASISSGAVTRLRNYRLFHIVRASILSGMRFVGHSVRVSQVAR